MQKYEIGVTDEFEAAHSLTGEFGPATQLHGHTYRVEVSIEARELGADGTFFDIGLLKAGLRAELQRLHYKHLNELEEFEGRNTTAEAVARFIGRKLAALVKAKAESMKVTVWESSSAWAAYSESFAD